MDCAHIFRSPQSGAPYSLVRTYKGDTEERWFVCGASGERVRAADTCSQCGSWRLKERGIGVLITDHNVRETLGLTDRTYIVYAGEVLTEGEPEEIVNNPDVRRLYLGEEFRM